MLFYLYIYHPAKNLNLTVLASIKGVGPQQVIVKTLVYERGVVTGGLFRKFPQESVREAEAMNIEQLEHLFEEKYIKPLQKRKRGKSLAFDNLKLMSTYQQTY